MAREPFTVTVAGGRLVGWLDGSGPNLLLLHGGPGLSADYLDGLIPELVPGYRVAVYQQRGLSPSTEEGPFTVAAHLADVAAVLRVLRWDKALVAGHSWGGYLAIHVAVALPDLLHGVLCIDPIGGVGDGGVAAFETAMIARTPETNRARAKELDERVLRGQATEQEASESLSLVWPRISLTLTPRLRCHLCGSRFRAMPRVMSRWSRSSPPSSRSSQTSRFRSASWLELRARSLPTRLAGPRPIGFPMRGWR
jgi:pimeloyl-ACP methyl ester carboxylesterase